MLVLTWQLVVGALTIFGFVGSFVLVYFIREMTRSTLFGELHGRLFFATGYAALISIMMITVITQVPVCGLLFGLLVQTVHEYLKPHYVLGIRLRY